MRVLLTGSVPAPARIVVLGGGSVWTPQLVAELAAVLPAGSLRVTLYGTDTNRVRDVAAFCGLLTEGAIGCDGAESLEDALGQADIVINQVRIGGWAARREDEELPPKFGMVGDETLGIGGLRTAIRTRPFIAAAAEAIVRGGRRPWILNLTNPTDIVCRYWRDCGMDLVVSLCDHPEKTIAEVCAARAWNPADLEYLGTNHTGWIIPGAASAPIPTRWRADAEHPERIVEAQRSGPSRAQHLAELVQELRVSIGERRTDGYRELISQRFPLWYGTTVVPLVKALVGQGDRRLVLGLPNSGRVPGLASEVEIETWAEAGAGVVRRDESRRGTQECVRYDDVARLGTIRDLAYRASIDPTREKIMQLAAADPFMNRGTIDERLIGWIRG